MDTECGQIIESQQRGPASVECPMKTNNNNINNAQRLIRQCAGNDLDLEGFEQLEILSDATVLTPNQFEQLSTDVFESSVTYSQFTNDDTTVLGITKSNYYTPRSSNILLSILW